MPSVILLSSPNNALFPYSSDAIQRVNQCLRDACHSIGMCQFMDCGDGDIHSFESNKTWKNWTNNSNASNCFSQGDFDYGIFVKAINLTTERSIVRRYIYSLFWGFQVSIWLLTPRIIKLLCIMDNKDDWDLLLVSCCSHLASKQLMILAFSLCLFKNNIIMKPFVHFSSNYPLLTLGSVFCDSLQKQISTLAGNQVPSYLVSEVLFTMAIIGLGLLLFALLIGNMQNFLQALWKRCVLPEFHISICHLNGFFNLRYLKRFLHFSGSCSVIIL